MLTMNTSNAPRTKLIFASALIGSLLVISGCQKSDNANEEQSLDAHSTDSDVKVTKMTPPESDASSADSNQKEIVEEDVELTTLDSDREIYSYTTDDTQAQNIATGSTTVDEIEKDQAKNTAKPANTKPIKAETQVTDVEYRDSKGKSIHVTFQTSAVDALEADLMLPSGKRVLLTAPIGQGNNPTYRSKDGSIELVTHGGGGSIDLLYEGKSTSFDAVSADAEVLTPQ